MTTRVLNSTNFYKRRGFGPLAWLFGALAQYRSRHTLAQLDPRMLEDVGLTDADVRSESQKSTWDVPAHWID